MILVAVGANLEPEGGGSAIETCRAAVAALDLLPGLRLRGLSRWWDSAPIPVASQPRYVNAVAHLAGALAPEELLRALQRIEAAHGRVRGERNAARTLDLDIVDIDGMVRDGPDPVLPHPRAHERAFVLAPLVELAPAWVHPRLGVPAATLLRGLSMQDLRPRST